ncbi:hypothetical protein LY90DRAFT_74525 [Neocallimastix californiae]|uniref:Uncharacterized protein n=1 Tax=Neocallimastix californiae TaxID=1754190 RepID=A0A1Y2BC02_9FUNG|nr:hypothetical protein LY90DRAFT_74525 [Neocallimastix californiae]|eukprot:ORY32361.1 hypothetical protein LY90DRAFT_74525 [Neocallimastix californiae]
MALTLSKKEFSKVDNSTLKLSSRKSESLNNSLGSLNSLNGTISKKKLPPVNTNNNWNKSATSQYSKGSQGLKRMENFCEELQNKCTEYREIINQAKNEIVELKDQIENLEKKRMMKLQLLDIYIEKINTQKEH